VGFIAAAIAVAPAARGDPPKSSTTPSAPPETAGQFADSLTEAALTSDPDAIYRRDGQRRVVDLGAGWSAWLDRTQASQLRNLTSLVANAGERETRVGFDFKGQTGLTARIATVDLGTARANEFKLATPPALVGGFGGALGYDQLRAGGIGINRSDASALASYRFSPAWLLEAGVHRATLKDDVTGDDERANFARAKLSYTPQAWPNLTLSSQVWRAVGSDDDGRLSFNGDYALISGGRLYAGASPRISLASGGGLQASQTFAHVVGAQTPLQRLIGTPGWGEIYAEWRGKSVADADDQVLLTGWRNRFALPARYIGELRFEHTEPLAGTTPQRVNTVGAGVSRRNVPENTMGTWFEYTHSDTVHSVYGLIKYTQRVTDNAVATVRIQAEDRRPNEQVGGVTNMKLSSGLGWREPEHKKLGVLYRYSFADKDARDAGQFDRAAHIVSAQFQYNLGNHASLAGRYAWRWAREQDPALAARRISQLVAGRLIWPVHRRWDVSVHGAAVRDAVLTPKTAFGAELGFRISSKVVLVGGVNVRGFADSELEAEDRFRKGGYVRLRFSVDALVAQWLDRPRRREPVNAPNQSFLWPSAEEQ
jgi:hypothetical protein